MTTWKEVTEEQYDEMLGMLPPASMRAPMGAQSGFLVGEPFTHRRCNVSGEVRADYAAYVMVDGKCYAGPNLTMPEWRALDVATVRP
jgi:hypothetical protein